MSVSLEASLVYRVSYWTAKATPKPPAPKRVKITFSLNAEVENSSLQHGTLKVNTQATSHRNLINQDKTRLSSL